MTSLRTAGPDNFGIRHHRHGQKLDYDRDGWLPWMFYYYLAMLRAAVQLLDHEAERY